MKKKDDEKESADDNGRKTIEVDINTNGDDNTGNDLDKVIANAMEENQHDINNRPPNPFESATFLSRCSFTLAYPLLQKGMSRPIQEEDIPSLDSLESSIFNRLIIENIWEQECINANKYKRRNNLGKALFWYYVKHTWWAELLMIMNMIARISQAVVLGLLMQQFGRYDYEDDDKGLDNKSNVTTSSSGTTTTTTTTTTTNDADIDIRKGYIYAILLTLCGLFAFPTKQQQFFETYRIGMQLRLGFVAAIYAKTLRLPSTTAATTNTTTSTGIGSNLTSGHVTNLVSNDVERFLHTAVSLPFLIQGPFIAFAILVVGISIVGPIFATGFGLLLLLIPLQAFLAKRFVFFRSKIASITDERVTMVSQAVSGVRVMKMNAWELEFLDRISKLRSKEVNILLKASQYRALNESFYFFSATILSVFTFVIDVLLGGVLTPKKVFTTLSLMSIVQHILTKNLPNAVMGLAECYVSCNRIQAFFELSEKKCLSEEICADETERSISLNKVTCYWSNGESNNELLVEDNVHGRVVALSNVSLLFQQGNLYCIIGKVGSGKSALLQTIAEELPISNGSISSTLKSIAYAPQDPWIMDGSIRENITMGLSYDDVWYGEVIAACNLEPDFSTFKDSDFTIVGDRGVQCSGGQRARISLARALYCDADLYLLDDPLSAVDAKVAHILYETILNLAVARNKCVILVTHQLHFVKSSACVLLDKGKIVANGTFTHCVKASHDGFLHHLANVKETNQESSDATDRVNAETYQEGETEDKGTEIEKYQEKEPHPIRQHTNKKDEDQAEERHVGIITMKTWRSYGQALGGIAIAFLIIFLFVISQTSLLLTIVFLGKWAEASIETQPSRFWLSLILSTTGGVVILAIIRAQAMFYFSIKASQQLHNRMLASVLRAKIEFFDTNPLGRILNRFSADVGIIDETFPFTLHDFLVGFFVVLGSIATVGVALPFCLLVLPPLLWYFTRLRRIFVSTTRELKRIEGIARSPIYAMVSESLQGVATIRTNGKVDYFLSKFERAHDSHTRAYFAFILSSRWFAFQLDILSFVLMSTTSIFSVLFHDQGWFNVEPATLGLALTLLIQISTTNLPWIVRQSAEVSNHMVSVERIVTYASLPSEAPLTTNLDKEFERWPEETSIEVKDLKVRYRANLPLVLNNVTFGVKSGHRIGIVGRTGAGKSTIAQTFFRILEPESGCIKVGGVDISLLGLHKLRNNMAVIPQSPVLFSGYTVHENLDPFGKRSEDEIMHALGCVRMREAVNSLPLGVDTPVAEGGINFSVGQRQLLCLARSILSNCKILILDEPTANIDAQSDQLLQQTLRDDQFADRTIVMVAHRLQTVVNFDSILVLGNGKVLEFGPPAELLAKKDGHFASMMQSTRTQESI